MKTNLTLLLVAFTFAAGLRPAHGADSAAPVLVVPATKGVLHVLADLPKNVDFKAGLKLVEIEGPRDSLPVQTIAGIAADGTKSPDRRRIVAHIVPREDAHKPRRFRLEAAEEADRASPAFSLSYVGPPDHHSLQISERGKPVLVYNGGVITDEKVPQRDKRRSRACYIHPLYGLNGEVLTDDFPKDHYHHHGVFWAWPHVEIDKKNYDLWEYKNISQRRVAELNSDAGSGEAVYAVENGWFVGDRKVMIERVWIEVAPASPFARAIDLDFTWIPVDRPITLRGAEGKSYGGLTIRFAVKDQKQSVITVPAGVTSHDLSEAPLPWADMTYPFGGVDRQSGAAIFVPRDHPDYPPTWLTRHYGPLCIGWPGVHGKTFEPGKSVHLRYRIWIHSSDVDLAALKSAYDDYLAAGAVHWE